MTVGDIARRDVRTASTDTSLEAIVGLLAESGSNGVPVTDAEGRLIGIVTEHDVIRVIVPAYELGKPEESSKIDLDFLLAARVDQVRDRPASSMMTTNVISLEEHEPLFRATSMMLLKKLKVVPVTRDGVFVGIVSRIDIAQALLGVRI